MTNPRWHVWPFTPGHMLRDVKRLRDDDWDTPDVRDHAEEKRARRAREAAARPPAPPEQCYRHDVHGTPECGTTVCVCHADRCYAWDCASPAAAMLRWPHQPRPWPVCEWEAAVREAERKRYARWADDLPVVDRAQVQERASGEH